MKYLADLFDESAGIEAIREKVVRLLERLEAERPTAETIFLDEVGLLSEGLQAKLLKVLEERSVRRLGSTRHERRSTCGFWRRPTKISGPRSTRAAFARTSTRAPSRPERRSPRAAPAPAVLSPGPPPPATSPPAPALFRWERRRVTLLRAALLAPLAPETLLETNRSLELLLNKIRSFGGEIGRAHV